MKTLRPTVLFLVFAFPLTGPGIAGDDEIPPFDRAPYLQSLTSTSVIIATRSAISKVRMNHRLRRFPQMVADFLTSIEESGLMELKGGAHYS